MLNQEKRLNILNDIAVLDLSALKQYLDKCQKEFVFSFHSIDIILINLFLMVNDSTDRCYLYLL